MKNYGKALSIIALTAFSFGTYAQNVTIPDANFKAYLVGNSAINTNADAEIQVSEASAFTGTILCQNLSISDLTGIETFTALTQLGCKNNSLSTLDLSNNTALVGLFCESNSLSTLNLSTALTYLSCHHNSLNTLDVSNNTALTVLVCQNNMLSTLDVTQNIALLNLNCSSNLLSTLDVSNNTTLALLTCAGNSLNTLDVSNTNLNQLNCAYNSLNSLNVANGNNINFNSFNATGNPSLACIQVDNVAYSTTNWTNIDTGASFSLSCSSVGINEQVNNINLSIYPNPVNNQMTIEIEEQIKSIVIIDVMGKTVKTITPTNNTVDVSNLTKGIYFLQIQTDKGLVSKKFIKE